ncbi:MAG: hypothetical protein MI741_05000, partial [Rhodospirillales bacterium]|nr:hypothetical protein [Rhodospirillales bacterium]
GWATDLVVMGAKEGVKELKLPIDEEQRVNAKIDQVANEFKAGNITIEEVGKVLENIMQGPVFSAGMAMLLERQYIDNSGLSEDEKAEASITLRRVAQGLVNNKLSEADFEYISDPISTVDAQGNRTIKDTATDAELREVLERAKERADSAGVEEQPAQVNFADEFEKAVDDALAQP